MSINMKFPRHEESHTAWIPVSGNLSTIIDVDLYTAPQRVTAA
jgi:hypothetical protein